MTEPDRQHQKWITHIMQTQQDDLIRNSAIAQQILDVLAAIKGTADRTSFFCEAEAIHRDWSRISAAQLVTTRLVRQMALFTVPELELQSYLYATQYLFLGETYVQFCVDLVCFLCHTMLGASPSSWESFLDRSARRTLHVKLTQLEKKGIRCFSDLYDRPLRNSLAHGNYEISRDGIFSCWSRNNRSDLRRFSLQELIHKFDLVSDLTMITSLLFSGCKSNNFLAAT